MIGQNLLRPFLAKEGIEGHRVHLRSLQGMESRIGPELSSSRMFEKVSHSLVDLAVTGLPFPHQCAG
jgi:hypothetical protein